MGGLFFQLGIAAADRAFFVFFHHEDGEADDKTAATGQ